MKRSGLRTLSTMDASSGQPGMILAELNIYHPEGMFACFRGVGSTDVANVGGRNKTHRGWLAAAIMTSLGLNGVYENSTGRKQLVGALRASIHWGMTNPEPL